MPMSDHPSVRIEKTFSVAPIDWLELPAELDGSRSHVALRSSQCVLGAVNDLEAIDAWLAFTAKDENTFRLYRHQVEKCLLWATITRGKALSSIDEEDTGAFEAFLLDPQPYRQWISNAMVRRDSPDWRPFRGLPSPARACQIVEIVSLLFDWLVSHRYVPWNPWYGTARSRRTIRQREMALMAADQFQKCVLTLPEWKYINRSLVSVRNDEQGARATLAIYLAYYADLKPGEILKLQRESFRIGPSIYGESPICRLHIANRKPIRASVVVLPPVLAALERYLVHSEKNKCLAFEEGGRPLFRYIYKRVPKGFLSLSELNRISKAQLRQAAEIARHEKNFISAQRLGQATLGWVTGFAPVFPYRRY